MNSSFVILDEAQNATNEQMKMFLTRLGFDSRAVITGDVTQVDLPGGTRSGLVEASRILANIEGIAFINFSERDVVRHRLVRDIIRAYEHEGALRGRGRGMEIRIEKRLGAGGPGMWPGWQRACGRF